MALSVHSFYGIADNYSTNQDIAETYFQSVLDAQAEATEYEAKALAAYENQDYESAQYYYELTVAAAEKTFENAKIVYDYYPYANNAPTSWAVNSAIAASQSADTAKGYADAALAEYETLTGWSKTAYFIRDEDDVDPLSLIFLGEGVQTETEDDAWFAHVDSVLDALYEVDDEYIPTTFYEPVTSSFSYIEDEYGRIGGLTSTGCSSTLDVAEFLSWSPPLQIKYLQEADVENYTITYDFFDGAVGTIEVEGAIDKSATYSGISVEPDGTEKSFSDTLDPDEITAFSADTDVLVISTEADAITGTEASQIGVMLSENGREVIILERLTYSEMMTLSLADQEKIANTSYFQENIAPALGLLPNSTTGIAVTSDAARTLLEGDIASVISEIEGVSLASDADRQIYIDELEIIQESLANSAIFSREDVAAQVAEIKERFDRAATYYNSTPGYSGLLINTSDKYMSADGDEALSSAYDTFIEQERVILYLTQSELQMVTLGGVETTDSEGNTSITYMDTASMVTMLQYNQSLKQEAIVTMRTVELEELNALSAAYAEMQRIINDTLKTFNSDGKGTRTLDIVWDEESEFTKRVILMFEDMASAPDHPLEQEFGVTRPVLDFFRNSAGTLNGFTKEDLEDYSSMLSDAATMLNPQLITNDITEDNRKGNTYSEEASSMMQRQYDLNTTIARGFT